MQSPTRAAPAMSRRRLPRLRRKPRSGLLTGAPKTLTGWRLLVGRLLVGAAIVGIWQLSYSLDLIEPLVARSPGQTFSFGWEILTDGTLLPALRVTLEATLVALVLGAVSGVLLGIALAFMPRVEALIDPYLSAANALPRVALAPVFIIYFGLGQGGKIALGFTLVFFVMLVNSRAGVRSVDRDVLTVATVMNLSTVQMLWKVFLPTAIPSIFAALRLSVIYSLLGVVTSELIASKAGLGQLIATYSGQFKLEGVYAIILVLAFVASVLNVAMASIESYLLRWQQN